MRASSLSDKRVIDLVTRYYIPIHVGRAALAQRSTEERNECERISRNAVKQGFNNWSVGVYIVNVDGTVLETMPVQKAANAEELLPLLERHIQQKQLRPRAAEALSRKKACEHPKAKNPDGLLLHVMTGFLDGRLGLSHNWVEITQSEWTALIPAENATAGSSWNIPDEVANKLFVHFFPPVSDHSSVTSEVQKGSLNVTLAGVSASEIQLALEASLEMLHRDAGDRMPPSTVQAKLVGSATVDRRQKGFKAFQMVSTKAIFTFRWRDRSTPKESRRPFVIGVEQQQ